ncbi:hypothetical protein PUN28_020595 [Cardiocondyla obscurior]|uniref:Uncharacterized protein n=1 Tax=Cardiocondyla obscurior TaxID=286306 RepID=A0AAW2E8N2_9HYME
MHTGLFRAFYFHQQPRYGQKTKKNIFEILQRSIERQLKKCIRFYIFIRSRDMAKNKKNIFEILQRSIVRQLKIDAYGPIRAFYFHQQPRYGQKTKKNIFEILQRSIMHTGLFRAFYFHQQPRYAAEIWPKTKKIFLKFNNVALSGIQNRCIRAYSEFYFHQSRDMANKNFEILQRSIVRN